MSDERTLTVAEVAARLERLPMTRYLWGLVWLAGGAWFVESLSVGATGVVLPALKQLWHLTPGQTGLLAVASTIGVVMGLPPAGWLADRFGRVRLLTAGILVYSGLTVLSAASTGFDMLVALRWLAGLGMGAVFPLPYSVVSEWVNRHRRTWLSGFLDAALSVGYFVAPLLGLLLIPAFPAAWAWRVFLVAAGLPLIYALLVRRYMPESPRWLVLQGRTREARRILEAAEKASWGTMRPAESESPPVSDPPAEAIPAAVPWNELVGRTLVSTAAATGTFFMFYVVMTYTPMIFAQLGLPYATSLGFAALVTAAAIPGKLVNGYLSEIWGRKAVFGLFMGSAAACAALFATLPALPALVASAMGMSFFGTGAFPGLKMYYAEQYPTSRRVSGSAWVEAIARTLGGIVGAALMPILWHQDGLRAAFSLIAAVAVFAVLVMAVAGQETRGLTLEAIQARYRARRRRKPVPLADL